jgi:essential nuclear protein 1
MPKATTPSRMSTAGRRHNPLTDDILSTGHLRTKAGKRKSKSVDDDEGEPGYIDAKASRKILQIGQDLAEEDATERRAAMGEDVEKPNTAFDFSSRFEGEEVISEDEDKFEEDQWGDEDVEDVVRS